MSGAENGGMTITEFLLARITEDEAAVRADDQGDSWGNPYDDGTAIEGTFTADRVRRECEAKRRIVAEHAEWQWIRDGKPFSTGTCGRCAEWDDVDYEGPPQVAWPCPTLGHLAAIWSNHPDYDPDWAVE